MCRRFSFACLSLGLLAGIVAGDAVSAEEKAGFKVHSFKVHSGCVHCFAFTADGKLVAAGDCLRGQGVKLFDIEKQKVRATLGGHGGGISFLAFSPDGRRLASAVTAALQKDGSYHGELRLWDTKTGIELAMHRQTAWIHSLAFSPDGRVLAVAADEVTLWDVGKTGTLQKKAVFGGQPAQVRVVTFSPDGKWLACAYRFETDVLKPHGVINIWDVRKAKNVQSMTHLNADYWIGNGLAFSPDSRTLASSANASIRIWDVRTGRMRMSMKAYNVLALAYSPDGKLLAASTGFGIALWETATGRRLKAVSAPGGDNEKRCAAVAFFKDGKLVATGAGDGMARLWDVAGLVKQQRKPGQRKRNRSN